MSKPYSNWIVSLTPSKDYDVSVTNSAKCWYLKQEVLELSQQMFLDCWYLLYAVQTVGADPSVGIAVNFGGSTESNFDIQSCLCMDKMRGDIKLLCATHRQDLVIDFSMMHALRFHLLTDLSNP